MLNRLLQLTTAVLLALPAVAFAVQLPVTGQTGCFDGDGKSRACVGSGEDGEKQAGVAWPAPRFSDNGNGTMTDMLTGLIWSKNANAPGSCPNAGQNMSWQQALDYVKCINTNSYLGSADWRLPNLNELESLVNAGTSNSSAWLTSNGLTQVQSGLYWSSTNDDSDSKTVPPSELNAWDVDLVSGNLPLTSAKTALRAAWPVRGASTSPAQIWKTGQDKCFDTAGFRINCNGTGQNADTEGGSAWPVPRFQANAGTTIAVDKLTGLLWTIESNSPGPAACSNAGRPMSWQEALDHVKCLNQSAYLGVDSWRIPNRKELRSLADYSSGNPALIDGNPFTAEAAKGNTFWSSTTEAAATKRAWAVSVFDGSVNGADKRNSLLLVWPVSGPDAIPPALTLNAVTATTGTATQTISGTVEAGITPVVKVSTAATVGPVMITGGTNWSAQINGLAAGTNNITVTATDPAGNVATSAATISLDAALPALTLNVSETPIGVTAQIISGTVEAGVIPVVTVNTAAVVGPVTVAGGTNWSVKIADLAVGANNITVTATDAVGNKTTSTATITVDTTPPALTMDTVATTTGTATQTISGTVEAGITPVVKVSTAATVGPVTITGGTNWSVKIADLAVGANNITVTATDPTGNVATSTATISLDAALPALTLNVSATPIGVPTQIISGTVEAGVIPVVTVNTAAVVGPVTVTGGTNWSVKIADLAVGANNITVTATDAVGNKATSTATITVDTTPPALTVDTVATRSKGTTRTISGTVEAGVTPVVTAGTGSTIGPVTVAGSTWSCQVSGLKPGANDVTVTATDAVGNPATKTVALTVLIADGILVGGGAVSVTDALKALRIAATLVPATTDDLLHGDVAPPDAQDGKIDVADALLILKKAVGLVSF